MKLNEIKALQESELDPNDKESVTKFLIHTLKMDPVEFGWHGRWKVDTDGTVDVDDDVDIDARKYGDIIDSHTGKLRVKFGKVRHFYISDSTALRSWENFPSSVTEDGRAIVVVKCPNLTSLVGISDHVKGVFELRIDNWDQIKEGGLGLLQIEGLKFIGGEYIGDKVQQEQFKIIEKYLGQPDKIFDCQQELIDAGYEQYAQL